MTINFYKKILIALFLTGLLYNPGFFVPKVNAVTVLGIGADAEIISATISANADAMMLNANAIAAKSEGTKQLNWAQQIAKWGKDNTDKIIEAIKKQLGQALKKLILDRIVDKTVEWIQRGGFEGKGGPIVADWGDFFQQAGEDLVGQIAQEAYPFLCGHMKVDLAFSFLQPQKFSTPVTCTLNQVVDNIDDLIKDFGKESKGRWITYNAIWEPENNSLGGGLIMQDQKESRLANLTNQKNIDATVNVGFKPQQVCKADPEHPGQKKCSIVTPGSAIGSTLTNTLMPDKLKTNTILNADDVATYLGAILDAVIYRYGQLAVGGLTKALGYSDSQNTDSTYANYQDALFSQVDRIAFQNDRSLYIDNINNIISIKSSTLAVLRQSRTAEQNLKNQLVLAQNCTLDNATLAQVTRLSDVGPKIQEIDNYLNDLQTRISDTDLDITVLRNTISEFNAMNTGSPQDDRRQMSDAYNRLQNSGALDPTATSLALTNAQQELTSIQDDSNNVLQHDSSEVGFTGFRDVINLCAAKLAQQANP